jgi:hypothetical protein
MNNFVSVYIFDFLIGLVGYSVARVSLPFLSLGRIYVEPFLSPHPGFNWLGYRRDENGRIEIEQTVAGFIGFIISLVAFFAIGRLIWASF